jgi:hypothetical protein
MCFFFIYFYPYLYLVLNLNFPSFFNLGSAIMGLDLVSFTVLDLGLAVEGSELILFSSIYSKTSSKHGRDLSTKSICPVFKLYLFISS